jgi:hypothetical protein
VLYEHAKSTIPALATRSFIESHVASVYEKGASSENQYDLECVGRAISLAQQSFLTLESVSITREVLFLEGMSFQDGFPWTSLEP